MYKNWKTKHYYISICGFKNFYFPDDTGYYSYNLINCFVGNLSSSKQRDLGNELYNWLSKFSYDSYFSIEKERSYE